MDMDRVAPGLERLVDRDAPLDRISYGTTFAEGPVWDRRNKQLFWVDIIGNTIWKWKPGVGREVVLRPSTPAQIAVALALLLFVPRLTELARERALGIYEPESLQAALDKVTALPPNAIVHVDVRRPGNVETAFALRAYMLLRGRLDLRTCVSAGPTELLAAVTPYVAHQTALVRADEPPRPHPLPQLDLVLTPEPVPSEAFAVPFFWSFAEPPLMRVDVQPGTACDASGVR